eukprot:scaffold12740_cov153-Skeletonema_marinoi.AAC.5
MHRRSADGRRHHKTDSMSQNHCCRIRHYEPPVIIFHLHEARGRTYVDPPPAANPYPAGPTGVLGHSPGPSWFKFSFLY